MPGNTETGLAEASATLAAMGTLATAGVGFEAAAEGGDEGGSRRLGGGGGAAGAFGLGGTTSR